MLTGQTESFLPGKINFFSGQVKFFYSVGVSGQVTAFSVQFECFLGYCCCLGGTFLAS